jgi:hypothetical protein
MIECSSCPVEHQVSPSENDLQLGLSFSRARQREPLPLAKDITSTSLSGWLLSQGCNDIEWSIIG